MPIDLDLKDQIRRSVDIVDVAAGYLDLRREGRIFKALCPWHDDHKPSMQVNPERQSYKCWVCGEGGDVFSFVMRSENIGFPEAIALLAERAGITIRPQKPLARPRRTPSESDAPGASVEDDGFPTESAGRDDADRPDAERGEDPKRAMYRAMAWAAELYRRELVDSPAGEVARRYLDDRGLTAESIERFKLGFAPDDWNFSARHAGRNVRPDVLEQVGLLARRQEKAGHYDRFRGRVLFPIHDAQGRAVGLGGRVLPGTDNSSPAKYINSPESPLFSKSSLLYGWDLARANVSRSRHVIVMEGYTDCIIAHQHGLTNVVAVLGTALTELHLRLLKRFAERVYLVLDGDAAGRRRANDLLPMFLANQVDLRVLTLPGQQDPCDYLLANGADAFRALLEQAPDALDHKYNVSMAELGGADSPHAVQRTVDDILGTMAAAPRSTLTTPGEVRIKEERILTSLSHRCGVPSDALRNRLAELRRGPRPGARIGPRRAIARNSDGSPADGAPRIEALDPGAPWERELLRLIVGWPEHLDEVRRRIGPDRLAGTHHRELFLKCCDLADEEIAPTLARLLLEFDDPSRKRLIVALEDDATSGIGGTGPEEGRGRLENLFLQVQRHDMRRESQAFRAALSGGRTTEAEQRDLLGDFLARKRSRVQEGGASAASTE